VFVAPPNKDAGACVEPGVFEVAAATKCQKYSKTVGKDGHVEPKLKGFCCPLSKGMSASIRKESWTRRAVLLAKASEAGCEKSA
jgi:hypothetical protein